MLRVEFIVGCCKGRKQELEWRQSEQRCWGLACELRARKRPEC